MRLLGILVMSALISACSTDFNPRYYYYGIELANLTGETITNLDIQVGADGRQLTCDEVTNNRICHERFGKRPYPTDGVRVSWQNASGETLTRELNPSVPITMVPSLAVGLVMEIDENNEISARFRQESFRLGG